MEKLYNNSRGTFATFSEDGCLYLSSAVRKRFQEDEECSGIDIYIDKENRRIVIEPNNDGEYTLNNKVYLRSIRNHMQPGRHEVFFTEGPEGQKWLSVSLDAI